MYAHFYYYVHPHFSESYKGHNYYRSVNFTSFTFDDINRNKLVLSV